MKILKRTPRIDMVQRVIAKRCEAIVPQLADELGFPKEEIDLELFNLTTVSTRAEWGKGEIDFGVLGPADGESAIAEKFVAYLNTNCYEALQEFWKVYLATDRPFETVSAPTPPKDDTKN